jgi:hypothetical protein
MKLPGFTANMLAHNTGYPTIEIMPQASGGGPLCQVCGHGSNTCHMSCGRFRKDHERYLQCHKDCADEWADCFMDCSQISIPPPAGGADWKCVWNDSIKAYQCA